MPSPAGVSAPVSVSPTVTSRLEHLLREELARLAQPRRVVGEEGAVDQVGDGLACRRCGADRCGRRAGTASSRAPCAARRRARAPRPRASAAPSARPPTPCRRARDATLLDRAARVGLRVRASCLAMRVDCIAVFAGRRCRTPSITACAASARIVGEQHQIEVARRDLPLAEHARLQPADESGPVVAAEQDHRELIDLSRLDQRQRLEQLRRACRSRPGR